MDRLNQANLPAVPATVQTPTYDRSNLKTGIVHFGVGGFHRAHMAMSIDRLLNQGKAKDWAICGVGLLEHDRRMRDVFAEQDCLFTLVLKHPDGQRHVSVIGSITEYIFAPENPTGLLEKLASPDTKIVSLTITEGGYNFDRVTGEFDAKTAAIAAELAPNSEPSTVFGFVTEGLRLRRERGLAPFTVQSCDNIQANGDVAKRMFTAFANLKDPDLGSWIEEFVRFPNSMVDRITPVTAPEDVVEVAETLGLEDHWPVVAEPFFQWVVEDEFPLGRPPLEEVDVQMVQDVMPYELMKLRLLNASHQGLTYFGYLSGYRYAHEATSDPAIAQFLMKYMVEEATPTLLPVPGVDLDAYRHKLIERFSNPEVKDTLARLCAESSDRIPKWLVPVIHERLAQGGDVALSAAIVASWARYAEAVDEQGEPINVVDPLKDVLVPIAQSQRVHPLAFIENRELFGDLVDNPKFTEPYLAALSSLHTNGAHATVVAISK
ncbi:mannitol dehydrogenase family protein [Rhodoluna sp. KAS3]|uniref:mannitol dehydrogenase family protein n=1 Tax=Rhodoluna sp. KAS3 TaxID=942880 RepID=UPI00222EF869|nr:mannitol dehydrogenase family protein [Rhodoluna sp. KAS3]BDS49584.1 mannitol 2-dehydrogenase [Rhodoluna sp. KAS3]